MLDLYKLEVFECVVEEGSFTAAAQRLLMTQSGVSQHIKELERSLGAELFTRSRRGAALTAGGVALYDFSQRILRLAAEAEIAVTDVAQLEGGQVLVQATPGVSIYVLSAWVHTFGERYPRLTASLETRITPEIVASVLARRADIGFVEGELDAGAAAKLAVQPLETIVQYVVAGPRHEFWDRAEIAPAELDGRVFIMRQPASQSRIWLDAMLRRHGVAPRIGAEFDNMESIKRTVAAGAGLTIMPKYAVHDEEAFGTLRAVPIAGEPLTRTLKLVWNARRYLSPVTRSLLTHLTPLYPALSEALARPLDA